ncbi:MAG: 2-amino-4-hydroxy-6-hydroxymethyldihydropteridine diphosphokinase [bacterium]
MNSNPDDVFVVLSAGSNIGHRKQNIKYAYTLLMESNALTSSRISSYYETEPVGKKEQEWFINVAIIGQTSLPLNNFIQLCKSIEYAVGRKKREPDAEREIDIDVIFYGDEMYETMELTVPHSRMHERKFVLEPASEIAAYSIHPKFKKTILQLLKECKDESVVRKCDTI